MTIEQQLRAAAERILYDGQQHDGRAVWWAHRKLRTPHWRATCELALAVITMPAPRTEMDGTPFSDRELSLGAQREWSLPS